MLGNISLGDCSQNESIKKACELFVSRYDVNPDMIPAMELHIFHHMDLTEILR